MRFINFLNRVFLSFIVRSLEIQLNDLREMMRLPMACDEYTALFIRHEEVSKELAKARAYRDSFLQPGNRKTYRTA